MEDAALVDNVDPARTLEVIIELREGLGSEVVAHARLDAPAPHVETAQRDPEATLTGEGGVEVVARLDPRTRVAIDEKVRLAIGVEGLHFFDPETGNAIRT
jgi:multiple sugar transport system ATP-binding protein